MANTELHNPAEEGVAGLKGINTKKEEDYGPLGIPRGQASFKAALWQANKAQAPIEDAGFVGINDARVDRKLTSVTDLENIDEFRGREQSEIGQALNGIVKGGILTGTTFLDGTVGAIVGLVQGVGNLFDDDENTGFWSGLWNNEFSKLMNDVNKNMEDVFKNYYTQDEIDNPLAARNIFSGNFIGDKFLKNLGFTIGAYYSGKGFVNLLNATKIPSVIGAAMKSARAPQMITSGAGAVASAFNEGRIMALEDSNNWRALQESQAKDRFDAAMKSSSYLSGDAKAIMEAMALDKYSEELQRIEADQAKMGNLEMFLNLPVLLASNVFQFGKLYSNGFKTARKLSGLKTSPFKAGAKAVGTGLSEGLEEVAQGAISNISGLGYEQDVLNFYKSKYNPEAEGQTIDWMKAVSKGMNDTFNDSATLEEFLIGGLTGLLGMPVFGKANTQQAWLGKGKMIGLAGGVGGEIQDYKEEKARIDGIVDYINNRTSNNKEFLNYYQGLIRHSKFQNDMDKAAVMGNSKDFKNAEFDQMLSDIMMFDNAGKIQDYMTLVESAFDTSDENLETIIENTTTTLEDGSKRGPFIDANGNKLTATAEGKAKMIEQLTKSKDEMVNTINNYIKVKDELDVSTGEQLSDDELESLTSMQMKIQNWKSRIVEMHPEIQKKFKALVKDYNTYRLNTRTSLEEERNLRSFEESLTALSELDADGLALRLRMNPKVIEQLYATIEPLVASGNSSLNITDLNNLFEQLKDTADLTKAVQKHTLKFNQYVSKPESLKEDLDKTYSELERSFEDIQIEKATNSILEGATSIEALKEALSSIPESRLAPAFQAALEKASEEQMQIFQDYDDLDNIAASFGSFDVAKYSNDTAALIAQNMESIISSATSKQDVMQALEALKNAFAENGNVDALNAVKDLESHINKFLEDISKVADSQTTSGGLMGTMAPTSEVSKQDGSLPPDAIQVPGNTKEEALQNAVDKVTELANNGNTELLKIVATDGVANPNITKEDNGIVAQAAKTFLEEQGITEADDASKAAADKQNDKQAVGYQPKGTPRLSSSIVTEYTINDSKNKKKVPYVPTEESLANLQSFLKESGAYRLLESGKIGVLNSRTNGGITINFLTNNEHPNTIFLATEVTETFKKRVNVTYTPVNINGKEYAILGTLKNDSSSDYINIVNVVGTETEGQTTPWKVASSVTKIKTFYSGRMVTSDGNGATEKSLSSLLTNKTLGKDYGFTIVYSNEDKYVGVDPAVDEVTPLNSYLPKDKRSGSLWLMTRGSNGVWYPHYVSIARTGEVEWSNSNFFDNIRKQLKTIVENNTLEKKLQAKVALNKTIFFPTGNKFSFTDEFISIGGTKINRKDYSNENDYIDAVINLIKSKNLRFQVSAKALSEDTTRESILNAGIIRTDLLQLEHINGSFDIYGIGDAPKGTSTSHTGSREVKADSRTTTLWFQGTQYNEFVEDDGTIVYQYASGEPVINQDIYNKLRVISMIESGSITGVEIGDSTLYEVVFNGTKYHMQKTKQQPIKAITPQLYGRLISKSTKKSTDLPPVGGLMGAMSKGIAKPKKDSPEFEVPQGAQPETEVAPEPAPQPEVKPAVQAKPAGESRKAALERMRNRGATKKEGIDLWIKEGQASIIEMTKSAGYTGALSADVIKQMFISNGITLDTIKDSEDFMDKLEYILNCKQ